jgi:hypothetical protein
MVEAPVLASSRGMAITLLNWTNQPQEDLTVSVDVSREVESVRTVRRGEVEFTTGKSGLEFQLPLETTDIVMVEYR